MRKALAALAALLASVAPASASGAGNEVVRLPNGHVSVNARGTPLGSLLEQFGALMVLDTSLVDGKIAQAQVDLALHDVPPDVALRATLQAAADVSFVLWGGDEHPEVRVAAYPSGPGAGKARAGGLSEAPPPPPPPPSPLELDPNLDPAVAAAIQAGISPDDPDLAMIGTGAPERTLAPEDDPDLAEILGPAPDQKKPEENK